MRAMTGFLGGLGLATALLLAARPASAEESAQIVAGRGVAQTWCVNCHVVAPGQASGSDQVPSFRTIAQLPGMTAEKLHTFLLQPHGKMPDFKLGVGDIDNVTAYILSLRP